MSRALVLLAILPAALAVAARAGEPPQTLQDAANAYERGDLAAAREAMIRLSGAGVPAADYNLAVMHLRGDMPHPSVPEALRLMRRAADHGFVTAMFGLGRLYEDGEVVPTDLAQAHRWYLRAAEAGSVDAQVAVATAHYLGRGAPKD